jgi:predicted CXXCH cytochrome family protein
MQQWKGLSIIIALVAIAVCSPESVAQISEDSYTCLACHGDEGTKETTIVFKNGTTLPIYVNEKSFANSVHATLDCSTCHSEFSSGEHPTRTFPNRSAYQLALSEPCQMCHSFTGIHQRMVQTQKRLACVECHSAHAVQPIDAQSESCTVCHLQSLQLILGDGSAQPLVFDNAAFQDSVHKKLRCVDCHFGFSSKEHPERTFQNKRELTFALSESCRRCHFDKYTRTLESVHYDLLRHNNTRAPVCTDCHGSHAIRSGRHDKLMAARRCKNCHQDIYQKYTKSVHGKALLFSDNQDVPVCSDCHQAHKITNPRLTDFRNHIPQMCGNCHANAKLMKKYGLSTAVLDSYLSDFHGVTLTFYKKQEKPSRHIAVCTDCHGIHDIVSLKGRDAAAIKVSLLERCQKCHPNATGNFPDTWISHYEPTIKRAPLVYMVNLFYKIFIPFMIIGLGLQILLHIWRYAINR